MPPDSAAIFHIALPRKAMRTMLGGLSIFTMLMTVPQVLTIWIGHKAAGVSLFSWGAYMLSAVVWFVYGIQKRDKNIYLPCIGWMALDVGVILGVLIYG
jgi:uncharacterized protein with PQ loop repeat